MEKFYCLYINKGQDFWPSTVSNSDENGGFTPELIYCHEKKRDFFITDGEHVRVIFLDTEDVTEYQFKVLATELLNHGLKCFVLITDRDDELLDAISECSDRLDIDYDYMEADCKEGMDEPPYLMQDVSEEKFLIICKNEFLLRSKAHMLAKYGFESNFAELVDKVHAIMELNQARIILRSGKMVKTTPMGIRPYEDESGEETYEEMICVVAPGKEDMMYGYRNKDIQFFTNWDDEEDCATPKYDLHTALYFYEHKLLPTTFFNEPVGLVCMMADKPNHLFHRIDEFLKENDIENPYVEEDFSVEVQSIEKRILVLRIKYPEPPEEPLCYEQLLITNVEGTECEFYCLEHPEDEDELPFLCQWVMDDENLIHGNMGRRSKEDFIMKSITLYMDKYYKRIN